MPARALIAILALVLLSAPAAAADPAAGITGRAKRSGKTRSVKLKPKRSLFGRTALPIKVRLRVTATDAAGNRRTKTKTIRVAG